MSDLNYTSIYPKIITDDKGNSVNESLAKKLTIEEYYDLLHHTHSVTDLVISGGMSYDELQNTVKTLSEMLNNLIGIVQVQQVTIDEMKAEMATIANIKDWDVTTPGIQDPEGNTLGDLMGFQMTEIE